MILAPFDQPAASHNGGTAKFGLDGFLYLSFGDGGAGGVTTGRSLDSFFSKILRIDVDAPAAGELYGIPCRQSLQERRRRTGDVRPRIS